MTRVVVSTRETFRRRTFMEPHTIDVIEQSVLGSLSGALRFPQVVARLQEVGVARYHVDFLRSEATHYLRNGESHVASLPMPPEPIAEELSASDVAAAVQAAQTEGLPYPEFLMRVRRAGCIGYFAYLDGRRVVYSGGQGDEHVEHFPS
jgi:uncharacterized protein YbcV (DUF1398 family)